MEKLNLSKEYDTRYIEYIYICNNGDKYIKLVKEIQEENYIPVYRKGGFLGIIER